MESTVIIKHVTEKSTQYVSFHGGTGTEWSENKNDARKFKLSKAKIVQRVLKTCNLVVVLEEC